MNSSTKSIGEIPISVTSSTSEKNSRGDIVFIHMSWGGVWAFSLYIDFFTKAGYNCHALDLRGHGKSGGTVEGATMQDYVDDVYNAVTSLNIQDPIIIGHSMGGLVALMYSAEHHVKATVSMDGSPSLEVQKTSEEKTYPASYSPQDAGMPENPMKAMMAFKDIYPWKLMQMKKMLGVESGVARSERKRGVSVPVEKLVRPLLFIGAEKGTSVSFGIGIKKATDQAEYYGAPVIEISNATHPGLLIGRHWKNGAQAILNWLDQTNL